MLHPDELQNENCLFHDRSWTRTCPGHVQNCVPKTSTSSFLGHLKRTGVSKSIEDAFHRKSHPQQMFRKSKRLSVKQESTYQAKLKPVQNSWAVGVLLLLPKDRRIGVTPTWTDADFLYNIICSVPDLEILACLWGHY